MREGGGLKECKLELERQMGGCGSGGTWSGRKGGRKGGRNKVGLGNVPHTPFAVLPLKRATATVY